MKKIIFLVSILFVAACTTETKVDYVLISGKITNTDAEKITVYSHYNPSEKMEISLAEDGSFKDTLKMNTDFYMLREGRNMSDFYAPGESEVVVNYDAKEKDSTINFSGNTSAINNYLLQKNKNFKEKIGDQKELYSKNEEEFKAQLLEVKNASENILKKTDGIPETFKNTEFKNIKYEYLSYLNNYKPAHSYYTKNKDFVVSPEFYDEINALNYDDENDFLFSSSYRGLVLAKYQKDAELLVKEDSIQHDIAYLKSVSEIKNENIKNKLLYDDAQYGITYTENLEDYYKLFAENSTDEENNVIMEKLYKELKALSKGNPSPKFTGYENFAGGTTSLVDLEGKFVYIDIWATWCGPCIAEIPSLKKLEKEYHTKNIEFVSISIDDKKDHEKWQKMVAEKELGGVQLFADKDWESAFVEAYKIKGIPRFILIDPQGNILNANAPRPSDEKLVSLFKELKI